MNSYIVQKRYFPLMAIALNKINNIISNSSIYNIPNLPMSRNYLTKSVQYLAHAVCWVEIRYVFLNILPNCRNAAMINNSGGSIEFTIVSYPKYQTESDCFPPAEFCLTLRHP